MLVSLDRMEFLSTSIPSFLQLLMVSWSLLSTLGRWHSLVSSLYWTILICSSYTFSQVPRDVSDAIYGRVQGAVYDTQNEYWLVPCGQYLNVSFNFGGQNYPIHPLDVVDNNFGIVDSSGKNVCIGAVSSLPP